MSYAQHRARTVIEKAGGNPDVAGPLAEWAQQQLDRPETERDHGVLVGEDGTILATTIQQRDRRGMSAVYVDSVTDPAHAEVVNWEAGMATAALRRLTGRGVIQVTAWDVCTGRGLPRMTPTQLREAREALGFSQAVLADRLGVREDTLSRWHRGAEQVPVRVPLELAAIAEAQAAACTTLAQSLRAQWATDPDA